MLERFVLSIRPKKCLDEKFLPHAYFCGNFNDHLK